MNIHGQNIIGSELSALGGKSYQGYNPRQGKPAPIQFHEADSGEIERAANLAQEAIPELQALDADRVAAFLEAIREEIIALGDSLLEIADEESALGLERLRGERDRTTNQIKLFANIVREGSWVGARIDTPQPDRKPIPKPDLRTLLQPIGPVAVFGASNFPLAFSVAGGDTISALAARNPVIVKAHPAHPGTSELVGVAVANAVKKSSLPSGTFSLLHGLSPDVSIALVSQPVVKALGFTGSQRAGRALFDAAARRPEPIPVFSEMGSVNPVFILSSVLQNAPEKIAEGLFKSVTLGLGQMCTCPGLVFALESDRFQVFLEHLNKHFEGSAPATMLNVTVAKGYRKAFEKASSLEGVTVRRSQREADGEKTEGQPGLLVTEAKIWLEQETLHEEIFGPATVIVRCNSEGEMLECARALQGSLTATVHGTSEELAQQRSLRNILTRKAGRIIFNGYPTGVEVGYAMQHGGPYPATTDSRFTSVGAAAIFRFARPVCYQNFPDKSLPPELQNANPRGIWRTLDGEFTKRPITTQAG